MNPAAHERARALLHAGQWRLTGLEQAELDEHVGGCAECRAYADDLAVIGPALARVMHARWDPARPPTVPDIAGQMRARALPARGAARKQKLAELLLMGAVAVAVIVALASLLPRIAPAVVATITPSAVVTAPSPPTGRIAFTSGGGVYVTQADSSQVVNLFHAGDSITSLAWSPDGLQLAFVAENAGRPEVFLMNADGSKLRQLTQTPITDTLYNYTVAWSGGDLPGGQRVAVAYYLPSPPPWERGTTVRLMDIYGGLGPWLPGPAYNPQWSPDNSFLAYLSLDVAGHPGLYVTNGLGTGQQRQIVDTAGDVSGTHDQLDDFAWSPIGAPGQARLAYMVKGPGQDEPASQVVDLSRMHARIYTILPDGTGRKLLLDLQPMPNGIIGLNWSPDGRYLLYLVDEQNNGCWTIHLLGMADQKVTELHAACVATRTALPSWSPDSRYIASTGGSGGMAVLDWALSLEHPGAGVTWLKGSGNVGTDRGPIWQPVGH